MENNEHLQHIRHTLAHLLAAAVLKGYPDAKLTLGPAIDNGFYYDIDFGTEASLDLNLADIQKTMRKTLSSWTGFTHREVSASEAENLFKDNPYKLELVKEIVERGEKITLYKAGNFEDLCRGGHVENPGKEISADAFKLDRVAGAYWRGDEKNPMLTRIYGLAFETKAQLDAYLTQQEEAKKRDHRVLGEKLDLFTISPLVGKGLPLFTQKGAWLRELLNEYSQSLRAAKGWQRVWSPHITKNDLYKISGHWDKFGGELFLVKSQETTDEMVMKPMNCPHHQQIYASKPRSYRDLPLKFMETTTVYRDEKAGELLGLSRVRSITQDDSHTFCLPEQIETIYQELIDVTKEFYGRFGMPLRARLSFSNPKNPAKYLGEPALWEKAQNILLDIAKKSNLDYFVAEGEAAFYGPKIDFMVKDSLGREWQLATPQLDFVQPARFGLTYTDNEGKDQTPVMIHFALMGSIERFLSVYIEHVAGNFPVWLAPVQMAIIPISTDKHLDYANNMAAKFAAQGFRFEVMKENDSLGKKIRAAEMQHIPYLLVIGDKEIEANAVGVRERGKGDLGQMTVDAFIEKAVKEINTKE